MAYYLSFELSDDDANRSDFADYTLGTSELLPNHFGELAPINIFLGENNSGKSRFMREIMKCNPTRTFDYSIAERLEGHVENALESLHSSCLDNFYKIELVAYQHISKNPELMGLLFPVDGSVTLNTKLEIDPIGEVSAMVAIVETLHEALEQPASFLTIVAQETVGQLNDRLQGCVSKLEQVFELYQAQTNGLFNGMHCETVSDRTVYHSNEVNIAFLHGAPAKHRGTLGYGGDESTHAPVVLDVILNFGETLLATLREVLQQSSKTQKRTYIPTLRTARTLTSPDGSRSQVDIMQSTITADYELDKSGVVIHTGLSLYSAINQSRNTDMIEREEFEKFQEFLSETFFNGARVVIVPNHRKTTILVAVDREERALPFLGDGIQAIILLLYPLFIASESAWFFIEEPEIHLHPGFQRLFISTIATHPVLLAKKLTIFLTTHSNHLLDFAQEEAKKINLFTFRKSLDGNGNGKYHVQLTAPTDMECLNALGVQNSSVFLANCTIWVEGITDRIYLKAYLDAYLRHLNQTYSLLEGLHYSFLEYAGANVSHYSFGAKSHHVSITPEALRDIQGLSISNRILLIADQDAGKETKHERLTSQQHAGFEYVVLEVREIENLLSPLVITRTLKKLYPELDFDPNKLQSEQFRGIYLGHYLRKKYPDIPETFAPAKPKGSGTISSAKKRKFAEVAADEINTWSMLSPEAQALTKRVFKFILGHNPRLGSN
ncbi:ATP-dependent nuclease [Hymenobacter lucidus]|uniref:AAA family ATPase n=1 Tax=Hymenobacter lucidus TaxID=2880930 RepID=A0ABS8AZB9_9BACT|nr:AAA family ATPase [Hymenobacter lucidus]MCB2411113.1 AAA family ATPase [Hymenobacter lucidus]